MSAPAATRDATITARELKARLDAERPTLLLDVRTPEEFGDWHIPNSINFTLHSLEAGERPVVPTDAELVTICLHGPRSEKARDILAAEGHSVRVLAGGMVAWNGVFDVANVPTPSAEVRQMRRVGKGCLSYLVASEGEAIVIDATIDIEAYLEEAQRLGARIVATVDTHAHADHVSGSRRLAEAAGALYRAPEEVGAAATGGIVRDGDDLAFGSAKLSVLATPGHTPGSVTFTLDDIIFTGDTLFVESVGRPDLGQDPRPHAKTLWSTLHDRLLSLPPSTRVLPGHYGPAVELVRERPIEATIGMLTKDLAALKMSQDDFVEWVVSHAAPPPANFATIKLHNKDLGEVDLDELRELEAGPNRCAVA